MKSLFSYCKARLARFLFHNKIKVAKGSKVIINNSILRNCRINVRGRNSSVNLGTNNRFQNCAIDVFGDDCEITLGCNNQVNHVWLWTEDLGSKIIIGDDNDFTGKIQLAAIEGTFIKIGNGNLFSREIQVSTGDSHSIIDAETKRRLNPSKGITIHNHVWVGMHTTICKGVSIPDNVIVGRGSILTKPVEKSNVALAGVPAKVVKEGVDWDAAKLPIT